MATYNNPLGVLVSPSDLPDSLGVFKDGLEDAFENIFFRDFNSFRDEFDNTNHIQLTLILTKLLKIEIPGVEGLALSLNPDYTAANNTAIDISLEYRWKIFERIRDFDFSQFDGSIASIFSMILEVIGMDEEYLLSEFITKFFDIGEIEDPDPLGAFITDFNQKVNPATPLSIDPTLEFSEATASLLEQLTTNGNDYNLIEVLFTHYFDFDDFEDRFNQLMDGLAEPFSLDSFVESLIPYVAAAIEDINLALEFPRSWLQPVDDQGEVLADPNIPSRLKFSAGRFSFSSTGGFDFEGLGAFGLTPSVIGNTGLILGFTNLKVDLSTDQSIPEALADGRGNAFKGVYAEEVSVTLPKKWFDSEDNHPGTTAKIVGRNMLVGTGGVSGQIALEAVNPDSTTEPELIKKLGGDGFEIGFKSFDITFSRGKVVESNISGHLKIPGLEDGNNEDAKIDIVGHLDEDGDFRISASEKDGFKPITIPKVADITIKSLAVGKEDSKFYVEAAGSIKFTNSVMDTLLEGQSIEIDKLRIYSDGSIEIVGGQIPIPANFTLNLGPVGVAITGINFGSYQEETSTGVRKYHRWGFDGAIGLGPLGVEARGKGMEFFYSVDNGPFEAFFRMKMIEVDLIIPANGTPQTTLAIIHGYLSIPQPGESQEFQGGIDLALPKAKIAGSAKMRLMPKHPAFLIDTEISLPTPIPIASTGLGVYDIRGLMGFRYVAEKESVGLTSGEDSWYDYYVYPPRGVDISKFSSPEQTKNYKNPVSLGAGATIATVGDDGTILSTRLFLLLSLPSVFILEGKASIISKRLELDATAEPPFFAFLAIGDNSVELGMGADFKLPQNSGLIAEMMARVEAGFFFNNPSAWYINAGTKENPNTSRMLSLITGESFLQLSAKGLELGSRTEFRFDKKFGPAHVKAWLFVEIGGAISFERPQFGGYIEAGGGLDVKVFFIKAAVDFYGILSAQAPKPFLIFAKIEVSGKVRLGPIKVKRSAKVKLKWEKSRTVDRTPVAPLLPDRAEELVKGIHMLSGTTFSLAKLHGDITQPFTLPTAPTAAFDAATVPLDTYIDFQFTKGLLPGKVADKIGGVNHPPERYTDLIPPKRTVKGGKQVQQVTHRYSIQDIKVLTYSKGAWREYNPYAALTAGATEVPDTSQLKIGQWQKNDKTYNAIRLMATSPFSFTERGQEGWFEPEQVGITPATLFCEGQQVTSGCGNWIEKPLDTTYATEVPFAVNGAYVTVSESDFQALDSTPGQEQATVSPQANDFNFEQSLAINNRHKARILLPDPSVKATLSLTTEADQVRIRFQASAFADGAEEPTYTDVQVVEKTAIELAAPVVYDDPQAPISRIVIEPIVPQASTARTSSQLPTLSSSPFGEASESAVASSTPQAQEPVSSPDKVLAPEPNALSASPFGNPAQSTSTPSLAKFGDPSGGDPGFGGPGGGGIGRGGPGGGDLGGGDTGGGKDGGSSGSSSGFGTIPTPVGPLTSAYFANSYYEQIPQVYNHVVHIPNQGTYTLGISGGNQ
ncbi:MAG: hypothetical protein AAFQ98_02755, partial [Bacteroidota bacterium]